MQMSMIRIMTKSMTIKGIHDHNSDRNYSIFSDDDKGNDHSEVPSDSNEFYYELPRIFDGDETDGEEVCKSISKVVDNICRKDTDVSALIHDLKAPSNCTGLDGPPANLRSCNS